MAFPDLIVNVGFICKPATILFIGRAWWETLINLGLLLLLVLLAIVEIPFFENAKDTLQKTFDFVHQH